MSWQKVSEPGLGQSTSFFFLSKNSSSEDRGNKYSVSTLLMIHGGLTL